MGKKRKLLKEKEKIAAKAKIVDYFLKAESAFNENPLLADKYVKLARRLAMKYRLRVPVAFKRRFCKHCYAYLVPNKTCRVRINNRRVVYSCFSCKKFMRFELSSKAKLSTTTKVL